MAKRRKKLGQIFLSSDTTIHGEHQLAERIRQALQDQQLVARIVQGLPLEQADVGDLSDLHLPDDVIRFWLDFFSALIAQVECGEQDDLDWAETAPEVQKHKGKLVVVYHKRVIMVGTDHAALLKKAAKKEHCDPEDLMVVVVPSARI